MRVGAVTTWKEPESLCGRPAVRHILDWTFCKKEVNICSVRSPNFMVYLSQQLTLPCVCTCVLVAQQCLTLCDSVGCNPPGSSVHGLLTRVCSHSLLQGILLTLGFEPRSPTLQADSLPSESYLLLYLFILQIFVENFRLNVRDLKVKKKKMLLFLPSGPQQ